MSISSTPMMPNLSPMKKKAVAAIIAVIIGHAGVMWAIQHMKTPELKPIDKTPLKVRFVQIKEPPQPLPPQPKAEPKKEQPKPKEVKEVKIVEKQLPPPPKKVEKVQQIKKSETAKPVVKPVETPVQATTITTTVSEVKVAKPAPAPVAPPVPPAPVAPPAPPSAKTVSIGGAGVQWSRSPKPSYSNRDLQGETRIVVILIEADEKGAIQSARVTRSSGLPALDEKILRAVRNAKFKPYKENGVAYPIKAEQPFELTLNAKG
ncbi:MULTISPECIES: TonB family protein [unclassified Acinetobacter]|uniref:energy transducer TonB n=1 Tax=unclassified Acinetobacter TaxID=196816 RepID=UPI0029351C08|nr:MULTISPECIES: TonB family protein [unclassified Acinetobacter]WOE31231.1 TonB family protein [Acinetobacter sp. SAAs470]WOE39427.1 TonB family protein [Acinetobacter sp. SAAs474]